MNRQEALARLNCITEGITEDEMESDKGWWETSTGAQFGTARLKELEELICELTS